MFDCPLGNTVLRYGILFNGIKVISVRFIGIQLFSIISVRLYLIEFDKTKSLTYWWSAVR